jgi:hypothetical protein
MKKLFAKSKAINEADDTMWAIKIAAALKKGDPYAHHWYRQPNGTLACNKCGEVNLTPVFDNLKKCAMHSDRHIQ